MSKISKSLAAIGTVFTYTSQKLTSPIDKANVFNICLHSTFNTNTSDISFDNLPFPDKSLCSLTITKHDVYTALADLDSTKAMGGDGILPLFLKHCATALVDPVHYLFSQCLLSLICLRNGAATSLHLSQNLVTNCKFQNSAPFHYL